MKVTVHLEGSNAAELAKGLRAHLAIYETPTTTGTTTTTAKTAATETTTPPKRGRPAKAAPVVTDEEEEFELSDDGDDTDLSDDEDEMTEESDDVPEEEEETVTKADLMTAAGKAAKRTSREAVIKVYKKYGGASANDIKAENYGKALAAINALK